MVEVAVESGRVIPEIAPGIKAIRGEGRPSKRLRRELDRMRRSAPR